MNKLFLFKLKTIVITIILLRTILNEFSMYVKNFKKLTLKIIKSNLKQHICFFKEIV